MFQRILVVCTGNICRSPVAAAMLAARLPGRRVESAGLGALVGRPVEPQARALAEAEGLTLDAHRARQLGTEMLEAADLVLVMSEGQRRAVADLSPAARGKAMLLGHWLTGEREIPDPFRKDDAAFARAHGLIDRAVAAWVERL
jgi:protein-tyrosine phosphatase